MPFALKSKVESELVDLQSKGIISPVKHASAPAIFQCHKEVLLQGLDGVSVYLDDILVAVRTLDEHLHRLAEALKRLQNSGMHLNKKKCFFLRSSIKYLGHVVDKDSIHPTEEKVRAIKEAPAPTNVTQLRSFLGVQVPPNLAATLTPLYTLLNKHQHWGWEDEQQLAFKQAKEALQSNALLIHCDPHKPLVLACDASDYGIGAMLSHIVNVGEERLITYISRTLSPAKKHYSQLEKEAFAIMFAVKKFHHYLIGRHFTIESNHQLLKTLPHICTQSRA